MAIGDGAGGLPIAAALRLSYTGADNKPHRPVMIHRAPFGSLERFIGVLTEHFAGAFPLWLAPVQVMVLQDPARKPVLMRRKCGRPLSPRACGWS